MANPRVLIACSQILLARAIEGVLRVEDGVEVVACEKYESDLTERVRILYPDVLILDRHDLAGAHDFAIPELCRDHPGLTVIVIDHGVNVVNVFQVYYRQVVVNDPLDIVGIVRGSNL